MRIISRFVVQASWSDTPHLSEQARADLIGSYRPHERDARTKGIPQMGSGSIYPVPESEIVCDPIKFPDYFKHGYALDVGWNRTAAVWGAHDTQADVLYLYSEHYRGQAEPAVHAESIRARGAWIPGLIDPASRGRSQVDGEQLFNQYRDLGLHLVPAKNGVESGIYEVWSRLSTGRLKVFATLTNWLAEYRLYRRDEKGKVVKDNDHLMDATRYLVTSAEEVMIFRPPEVYMAGRRKANVAVMDYDPCAYGSAA